MAYTEKVSLNGTALSFLLYECINSMPSREGFLIGDVTSEITNHISDSQSDNARLDTQIIIRTVLPLPSVSLFYQPTGRIKEDVLTELLSTTAAEVVGWYKYRSNNGIKPTFRDKLISKGLQRYFEKYHGKRHFVMCNLSQKTSSSNSTHTLTYRFGKINCFDLYEYIEDVTANLGEKHTGYKKPQKVAQNSVFNKIVNECNIESNNTNDAILLIQEAVDMRLAQEAKIAFKNETIVRELEAEIRQITEILSEKQTMDLQATYEKMVEEKLLNKEQEMAQEYITALKEPSQIDIFNISNSTNSNHSNDAENIRQINDLPNVWSSSSVLTSSSLDKKPTLNYANALKNKLDAPSTSKTKHEETEDLICFDVDEKPVTKPIAIRSDEVKCSGDSSPEY